MMGLGMDSVIKIDFEKTTPEEFERIVIEKNVFCINSTFGTTSYGTLESVKKFEEVKLSALSIRSIKFQFLTTQF